MRPLNLFPQNILAEFAAISPAPAPSGGDPYRRSSHHRQALPIDRPDRIGNAVPGRRNGVVRPEIRENGRLHWSSTRVRMRTRQDRSAGSRTLPAERYPPRPLPPPWHSDSAHPIRGPVRRLHPRFRMLRQSHRLPTGPSSHSTQHQRPVWHDIAPGRAPTRFCRQAASELYRADGSIRFWPER